MNITDADRGAVADYLADPFIRARRHDNHPLVQAFSNHRIAGEEAMREACIADIETWFPGASIDKPKHAAGKALRDSLRAINLETPDAG